MNRTFRGITIDWSDDFENANDSIRVNCEFDSNMIDETDLQYEQQYEPRISTFLPISIDDDFEKFRINLWSTTSIRNSFSITNTSFTQLQFEKQLDSRISSFLGIKIDSSDEDENVSDSIRVKCECDSNMIDESDLQFEKHFDPRISTFCGIKID
jgi:hypothetical protein